MKKILAISDAASLALHTMALLASHPDKIFPNREISSTLQASEHHLSKILQRLNKAGFTTSIRGPSGGFRIAPGWEEISLLEVFEAIEGPFKPTECLLTRPICSGKGCILGNLLKNVNRQILAALGGKKLSDVTNFFN